MFGIRRGHCCGVGSIPGPALPKKNFFLISPFNGKNNNKQIKTNFRKQVFAEIMCVCVCVYLFFFKLISLGVRVVHLHVSASSLGAPLLSFTLLFLHTGLLPSPPVLSSSSSFFLHWHHVAQEIPSFIPCHFLFSVLHLKSKHVEHFLITIPKLN